MAKGMLLDPKVMKKAVKTERMGFKKVVNSQDLHFMITLKRVVSEKMRNISFSGRRRILLNQKEGQKISKVIYGS